MALSRTKSLALTGAALLASGCVSHAGLDPRGHMSDPLGMPSFATLGRHVDPAAQWPAEKWWVGLADPQLDALVAEALVGSPDLEEAAARVRKASALADRSRSARGVEVDAAAGVVRSRLARPDDFTLQGDRYVTVSSLDVRLDYTFDLWGGRRAAWEAALGQAQAAEVDAQASKLVLTSNLVRTYNQLALSYELADFARQDAARLAQMMAIANRRYASGADDRSQVSLLSAQHEQAVARANETQNTVELLKLQVVTFLGHGLDRADTLRRPEIRRRDVAALPANLPAGLLGRRPDIVAARLRVLAAMKNTDSLKTDFYPNVNLSALVGLHSLAPESLLAAASRFWRVAPAITLPIFDAGKLRANLRAGYADLDLAVAQYNKILAQALLEVGSLISEADALDKRIPQLQNSMLGMQQVEKLARERYRAGDSDALDYLSVQGRLLDSEAAVARAKSRRIDLTASLSVALGGGTLMVDRKEKISAR